MAAALAVAVVQAAMGVPVFRTHDGPFAVASLARFRAEIAASGTLPHWTFDAYAGLGAPIFMFYPPGAFTAAAALGVALPGVSEVTLIEVAGVLFRALAILSCAAWLRLHVGWAHALAGGALYALMPYVAVLNPQLRLAFAETAAAALLPLVFLAVNLGAGRVVRTMALTAPAIAGLALVHLPSTVLAGGLAVLYALLLPARLSWAMVRGAAGTMLGAALGLGIAGAHVVPTLSMLSEISAAALKGQPSKSVEGGTYSLEPMDHFLLMPGTNTIGGLYFNLSLVPPIVAAALGARAALRGAGPARAVLGTLAVAVFLTLPISAPVWRLPLPLREVQFPWRLLLPVSLLAAALLALALPRLGPALRRLTLAAGLAAAACAIVLAIARGEGGRAGQARTDDVLRSAHTDAPEYLPATASARGWLEHWREGPERLRSEGRSASGCPARGGPLAATRVPDGLLIDVEGCVGLTVLPQFFFPGWSASAGAPLPVHADPATGLVRVDLPAGTRNVLLQRVRLPVEQRGLHVTAVALLLWAVCIASAFGWRRARQGLRRWLLPR